MGLAVGACGDMDNSDDPAALEITGTTKRAADEASTALSSEEATQSACGRDTLRYRAAANRCCCNYDDIDNPKSLTVVYTEACIDGRWVTKGWSCTGRRCNQGTQCPI